jgi:hypothetical protein
VIHFQFGQLDSSVSQTTCATPWKVTWALAIPDGNVTTLEDSVLEVALMG